jgi:hypothetical protein
MKKPQDGAKQWQGCLMQLYPEIQDIATIDKNFILAVISFYVAYNSRNDI